VDWPCEVHTLFREFNLGCREAVSSAITWFFKNELEGIILEDDCLPNPTFFPYCAELLERYRNEPKIAMISGDNFQKQPFSDESYYFSRITHIWGWATWRRAWALYDKELSTYDPRQASYLLTAIRNDVNFVSYWHDRFQQTKSGVIDTWDYQWLWTCWSTGGLACAPGVNLISNIGFGADATHTTGGESPFANLATASIQLPLRDPTKIVPDVAKDNYIFRYHFGIHPFTLRFKIWSWLRRALNKLSAAL
jgi:hypothetical protein